MSECIEPDINVSDSLSVATRTLLAQAFALDRMFFRFGREAAAGKRLDRRRMNKALKAQDRCRATIKILMGLQAAAAAKEKFSDSNESTIQTLKTTCIANSLLRDHLAVPPPRAIRPHKRLWSRKTWSAERRARHAAAIREWQPWNKSTGPRTQEGKARSSTNALKHGRRSRAHIEMRRAERGLLSDSAFNIALAKLSLRTLSTRATFPSPLGGEVEVPARSGALRARLADLSAEAHRGKAVAAAQRRQVGGLSPRRQAPVSHRIGIGRASPALVPFHRKFSGNRGLSGVLPADNAASRRRWRIARHDEEDIRLK